MSAGVSSGVSALVCRCFARLAAFRDLRGPADRPLGASGPRAGGADARPRHSRPGRGRGRTGRSRPSLPITCRDREECGCRARTGQKVPRGDAMRRGIRETGVKNTLLFGEEKPLQTFRGCMRPRIIHRFFESRGKRPEGELESSVLVFCGQPRQPSTWTLGPRSVDLLSPGRCAGALLFPGGASGGAAEQKGRTPCRRGSARGPGRGSFPSSDSLAGEKLHTKRAIGKAVRRGGRGPAAPGRWGRAVCAG